MNIDLRAINFSVSNPDHPNVEKLSKISKKQERTGIAMIKIIQSTDCIRKMFADYLGDKSSDGRLQVFNPIQIFHINLDRQLYNSPRHVAAVDTQRPCRTVNSSKVVSHVRLPRLVTCIC